MFTKGQEVTLFRNWDTKGTVKVTNLIVHSCGKRQMILVDADGVKFEGRNFLPTEKQSGLFNLVAPRVSREIAEAKALQIGADVVAYERAWMEPLAGKTGPAFTSNRQSTYRLAS